MKKLMLLIVVLIAMAVSASGQTMPCEDVPCEVGLPFINKLIEVVLPECPQCTLAIDYYYREGICNGQI